MPVGFEEPFAQPRNFLGVERNTLYAGIQERISRFAVVLEIHAVEIFVSLLHNFAHDLLIRVAQLAERSPVNRHESNRVNERDLGDILDLRVPLQYQRANRRHGDDIDQSGLQPCQDVCERQRNGRK